MIVSSAGINFNSYAQGIINVSEIIEINGNSVNDIKDISDFSKDGLNKIKTSNKNYLAPKEILNEEFLKKETALARTLLKRHFFKHQSKYNNNGRLLL